MERSPSVVHASALARVGRAPKQWRQPLLRFGKARGADLLHVTAPVTRARLAEPRFGLYHHVATAHELAFVVRGRACIVTSQQRFVLTPGKVLLVGPGVYHAELPAESGGAYCAYWCQCTRKHAHFSESRYTGGRLGVTGLNLQGHTDVESLLSAALSELSTDRPDGREGAHHLLAYLALILVRRLEAGAAQRFRDSRAAVGDSHTWQQIDRALAFCQRSFRDDIRVADVARAVGLNAEQLGETFASHLGVSLAQYVLSLRVAEAKGLLAEGRLRVCEVARAVGYAYPEHFTRAFTRTVGLSPTAYRRRLAGG